MTGAEQAQPRGWYQHPTDADYEALWNGKAWTGMRRPKAGTAAARDRALRRVATYIGLAFLVPVLLITFLPTKVGTFDCGTWLQRDHPIVLGTEAGTLIGNVTEVAVDGECQNKLDDRRLFALVLLGFGVVARFAFVPIVKAVQQPTTT